LFRGHQNRGCERKGEGQVKELSRLMERRRRKKEWFHQERGREEENNHDDPTFDLSKYALLLQHQDQDQEE